MHTDILLGIDIGTTALKLCVFERLGGALRAEATRRLRVDTLPDGGKETPIPALDRAFASALGEVRAAVGVTAWKRLAGIGLAAQGGSSIIADRATGRALTPMLLWNDGRTRHELDAIVRRAPPDIWRRRVLSDSPPAGLGRLVWLRERRPELFDDRRIHIGAGEYLYMRLTGRWQQDAGNAIQIGSYNAAAQRLDDSLLALIGVPVSFFAPLRQGHATAPLSREGAQAIGTRTNVPVAGPYIDQEAGYLAAVGVAPHPLDCSLGTAWVGNFVLPAHLEGWSPQQLVIPAPTGRGRLVILPVPTGNAAWEWGLRELVGSTDSRDALRRATVILRELPPSDLIAVPWFAQANPAPPHVEGAGVFLGLHERTTHKQLLRALAAGMVCELARVLAAVASSRAIDGVVLGGGMSRGPFFLNALAALFAPLPCFVRAREASPAARGALFAFSAKIAAADVRRMLPPEPEFADALRGAYERYVAAFQRVYGNVAAGEAYRITRKTARSS